MYNVGDIERGEAYEKVQLYSAVQVTHFVHTGSPVVGMVTDMQPVPHNCYL